MTILGYRRIYLEKVIRPGHVQKNSVPDAAARVTRALERVPASGLALGGVTSLQCGAALATRLFPAIGVAGVVALRLSFAAIILGAWWRPRLRRDRATWALIVLTGSLLAVHHLSYYQAIDRLPLGAATTIEFVGPLAVALVTAHRRSHIAWALLAALGVIAIAGPRRPPQRAGRSVRLRRRCLLGWLHHRVGHSHPPRR